MRKKFTVNRAAVPSNFPLFASPVAGVTSITTRKARQGLTYGNEDNLHG
jgi:hypothetical protein